MATIVNTAIDSLDIRMSRNRYPSEWLRDAATAWRAAFEEWWESRGRKREYPLVEIEGIGTFRVQPAHLPYEFVLINPEIGDVRIWNPDRWPTAIGSETGQFYISFRSRHLQFAGAESAAYQMIEALERQMCGNEIIEHGKPLDNLEFNRITRVDLAVDTQEDRGMEMADLDAYVYRARKVQFKTIDAINDDIEKACSEFLRSERGRAKASGAKLVNENVGASLVDNKGGAKYMKATLEALARSADPEKALRRLMFSLAEVWGVTPFRENWVHVGSKRLETVYFGRYGSPLYARRYDKLASLEVQSKEYMREVWASAGWDGESPVWRTEFSLSGDFLRHAEVEGCQLDLREFALFVAAVPHVWGYLTKRWLRHCIPSGDNRSRWATSPFWGVIQNAFGDGLPLQRYKPSPKPNEDQLFAQWKGLTISLAAIRRSLRFNDPHMQISRDEIPDPMIPLLGSILEWVDGDEGREAVERRMQLYGLDSMTDTYYSAHLRWRRMLDGDGS